ncbi:MAG: N-formylglutamate amidohydrolase [Planctomycetota bacterium]
MSTVVISCEHATDRVPAAYAPWFASAAAALQSHRGVDFGAALLADELADALGVPALHADVTRLLVDTNRSQGERAIFSEWSWPMPEDLRRRALREHWSHHRDRVTAAVRAVIDGGGSAVHVGVHSFTPELDGEVREIDVAWLFDPDRPAEVRFVDAWQRALAEAAPELRLRRNEPYQGTSDGLTTDLRLQFDDARYLGIELEVNQGLALGDAAAWRRLRRALVATVPRPSSHRVLT